MREQITSTCSGQINGALKAIPVSVMWCAEAAVCDASLVVSVLCLDVHPCFVCICTLSFQLFHISPLTHQRADPEWHHTAHTRPTSSLSVRSLEILLNILEMPFPSVWKWTSPLFLHDSYSISVIFVHHTSSMWWNMVHPWQESKSCHDPSWWR